MKFALVTTNHYGADGVCNEYPYLLIEERCKRVELEFTRPYRDPVLDKKDIIEILLIEGDADYILNLVSELSELFKNPKMIFDFSTDNYLGHPLIEIYNDFRE
jgi:hypothetical protein